MKYQINSRTFEIDYLYTPTHKGTPTLENFDPGEPDSGGEIFDVEIYYYSQHFKRTFEIWFYMLSEKEQNKIERKIHEIEAQIR